MNANDQRFRSAVARQEHLLIGCPYGATAKRGALLLASSFFIILAGCFSTDQMTTLKQNSRPDAKLDLYNATARLEFDDGRPAEAADAYALAIDRAAIIDDPAAAAKAAYSLAITRAATLDYPAALAALDIAAYDAHRAHVDPTDLLLVRARVDLLSGNPAEASHVADQVLAEPRSKPTPQRRAQAHAIKGLAACQRKDIEAAAMEERYVYWLNDNPRLPIVDAMRSGLRGEIDLLRKRPQFAATDFEGQAFDSREAGDYRTMYHALAKAGRAYGMAGNPARAADCLYRAARAADANDDRDAATFVAEAAAAARKVNDPQLIALTQSLSERVRRN